MPTVAVLMGSDSDLPTVKEACNVLKQFGVTFEARVLSAHRCPEELIRYVKESETAGVQVFIAAAGGAAHLAGVVAANTTRPVIGIPIQAGALGGMDSLLSTVQMPGGIPVATMAIGNGGATNAGLFAVQILALSDKTLAEKLKQHRRDQTAKVQERDRLVKQEMAGS